MWLTSLLSVPRAGRTLSRRNRVRRSCPRRPPARPLYLEWLEERIVPEGNDAPLPVVLRDVPYAFGPLLTGRSEPCENLRLPATLDLVDEEGWVWVDPAHKYRDVTGIVEPSADGSYVNHTDFAAFHDSHDQNTIIRVDVSDDANSNIVSTAN